MRNPEGIRLVIEFAVADAARFREMAEAMAAVTADEPGTVAYDWYLDEERSVGVLYEAYADHAAIVAHATGAVFTDVAPEFTDAMTISSVQVFGDAERLQANGDVLGAPTTFYGPAIAKITP